MFRLLCMIIPLDQVKQSSPLTEGDNHAKGGQEGAVGRPPLSPGSTKRLGRAFFVIFFAKPKNIKGVSR